MFVGRNKELEILRRRYDSDQFEFGILHGRRRVGKTTLIKESIKGYRSLYFACPQANASTILDHLSATYAKFKGLPRFRFDQLEDLLDLLFVEDRLIIIFDEFTYLTQSDNSAESVFQHSIDKHSITSNVKLLVSGSEVGMYENLFSVSKPLYNRQTFQLKIEECDYYEASLYVPHYDVFDKIRTYAVFGGLPFYLARLNDQKTLRENIESLVIHPSAAFSDEVYMMVSSELRSVSEYQSVLQALASGNTSLSTIDSQSHVNSTDRTAKILSRLIAMGIVDKEVRFLDRPNSTKTLYRIQNNFLCFYYQFIWRNATARATLESSEFFDMFIRDDLEFYVSKRFETICKQYLLRHFHSQTKEAIREIGRYWLHDKVQKKEYEIDLCVEGTKHRYAFECKWSIHPVGNSIVRELYAKGKEIHADRFGVFSKSGVTAEFDSGCDVFMPADLFSI